MKGKKFKNTMVKIDLHLHSSYSKQNGDAIQWKSSYEAIEKLINQNVKIAAFSDHNTLNVEFYLKCYELAKTANILLLPAIEVNVVRIDGKIANIIFIFDKLTKNELMEISDIAKKEIPKRGISLEKCNDIFKKYNTIKIPHVGKSDHFKYEDLLKIEFDAIEISNLKHPNYLNVIKHNINTSVVAFSDTHKWNLYPEQGKLITVIDEIKELSFNQLKNAFKKNQNYIKERINV